MNKPTMGVCAWSPDYKSTPARIPTTAQLGYFIEKLLQLKRCRDLIRSASLAVENIYAEADALLASYEQPNPPNIRHEPDGGKAAPKAP